MDGTEVAPTTPTSPPLSVNHVPGVNVLYGGTGAPEKVPTDSPFTWSAMPPVDENRLVPVGVAPYCAQKIMSAMSCRTMASAPNGGASGLPLFQKSIGVVGPLSELYGGFE